jgi:hypothetical protein
VNFKELNQKDVAIYANVCGADSEMSFDASIEAKWQKSIILIQI